MDQESNRMEQHPVQCRNGCGFYSNAGTDGLCSVCYKETIKKKQQVHNTLATDSTNGSNANTMDTATTTVPTIPKEPRSNDDDSMDTTPAPLTSCSSAPEFAGMGPERSSEAVASSSVPGNATTLATSASSAAIVDSQSQPKDASAKKKKNRCLVCKKKVGLTGFTCRCDGLFCSLHRYSDMHECSFDYKELGAEEIRKSNPVVVADKVKKI